VQGGKGKERGEGGEERGEEGRRRERGGRKGSGPLMYLYIFLRITYAFQ